MCFRFNRQYSRKTGLLRQSNNPTTAHGTILDDLNIKSDHVIYSLSKKGRWKVPEMLKESILAGNYKNLKTNVKLVLSHNLMKKSHTVGFYASKGKVKKVEGKRTYFNGDSVISSTNKHNNLSDLQVEVLYPCPTSSSVLHNPKYVGHNIEKSENGRCKTSNSRKHRQKLTVKKYCEDLEEAEYWDQSDDETELDADLAQYMYSNSNKESETNTELLEDIMIHAALMQSICQRSPRVPSEIHDTKCKKIYEVDNVAGGVESESDVESASFSTNTEANKTVMEPVYVIVPRKEIEIPALKQCYGNRYKECACFPRKFLIDISERIKKRMSTSGCLKLEKYNSSKWDLTSCLIFTQDNMDANNTESQCVLKVIMNIGTNSDNLKIWTLFDYFEGFLECVIGRAVSFLDMMSVEGFKEKEKEPMRMKAHLKFENLNESQKVLKSFASLTRNKCFQEIFNTNQDKVNDDFEMVPSEYCGICFDELATGGKPGTALTSCGHWFCDDCWLDHCRSRMKMGSLFVSCPEHGCDEDVPDSVVLGFVNIYEVLGMIKRKQEVRLESSIDSKWCPNPHCNRIIKVSLSKKVNDISCTCGSQLCFQCLQPPHWPVPCELVETYWKRLKRLGDDIHIFQSSVQVRGKQCPKCKRFVEKLGGCFYMNCICGASFCWGCLQTYPGHVYSERCNQYKNGDLKGTKSIQVYNMETYENIKGSRSADYKRAVNHRKARHTIQINEIRAGARQIQFKCKSLAKKKGPLHFPMFCEDVITGNTTVEDEIHKLLTNSVSIYTEIHHITEYCYVLLDKRGEKKKHAQFRDTLGLLSYSADRIKEILKHPVEMKDCRAVISTLKHIQQKSSEMTKSVVSYVEKVMC